MTKIFKVPFADTGDKISPPDSVQSDGSVSYPIGYGFDYQRDTSLDSGGAPVDPLAKVFPREQHNGILNDITTAIGEMQINGLPVWQLAGAPYPVNALVRHADSNWRSFVSNNNTTPGASGASWIDLGYQPDASETVKGIAKIATTSLAQGGTNDTDMMTPFKVRQAIDNVAPGQATETTLGIARIATTSEAQFGVNDTRMMTPLKTRQAIDNLLPVQATTALAGIARIATAALATAGTDNITIITPALLKQLFPKRAFSANDFIRIPDVPGGLIIQMGIGTSYPDASVIQTLPTPFPNGLLTCGAQPTEAWTSDITIRFIPAGDKKSTFYLDNSYTTSGPAYYWAIGY